MKQYICPMEATSDIIGGKWKAVILYYLFKGPMRFGELQRKLSPITQRMLTLQLRELEQDGIIHREVYAQIPPKTEYTLTSFGGSLQPVISTMTEWGIQYTQKAEGSE